MNRALIVALALGAIVPRVAWAGKHKKGKTSHADKHRTRTVADSDDDHGKADDAKDDADDDQATDDDSDSDKSDKSDQDGSDDSDADAGDAKPAAEPTPEQLVKQQDMAGHAVGGKKPVNAFEKNRFFVDKLDTRKTEKSTLIQGSVTSSSFFYSESGGAYPVTTMGANVGNNASKFSRYFTELRLQTDFRHIDAGRWDARIDARTRFVNTPSPATVGFSPVTQTTVQSGLLGKNEYDLRELWVVRNGDRTDVFIGRQYITDLAAVKIDGIRIDHASSSKLTLLGFGGLYPLRGSRSITTDYVDLKSPDVAADGTATLKSEGRFVGAGGFGGAYRTPVAYGAIGAVALVPFAAESPRIFVTSNGYYRYGSKLDLYHFVLVDLVGNNDALGAGHEGLTNLSAGANIKPTDRLRLTASYNRVDTDTLNLQAYAFLQQPDQNQSVVQNEVYLSRLSTNELRGSISAGLGSLQRFELTAAASYRFRPSFSVMPPAVVVNGTATPGTPQSIKGGKSIELYASAIDRHSIKDTRIGVEVVRTFSAGDVAFQRSELLVLRAFARREIRGGRGEWSAELGYATTKDDPLGGTCPGLGDINTCYGNTSGTLLDLGGTLYYRLNPNWYGMANVYITETDLESESMPAPGMTMVTKDPGILGMSGYLQIAYRF